MQATLNFKEARYGYATQVNNVWVISLDFMPKILAALLALVNAIWVGRKLAKTLVALLVKTSLPGIHKGFFRNTITRLFAQLGESAQVRIVSYRPLPCRLPRIQLLRYGMLHCIHFLVCFATVIVSRQNAFLKTNFLAIEFRIICSS